MSKEGPKRADIRRTAIILGLIAFAFYFAFIYMGVDRS